MSPTVDAALMFHLTHATLSMLVALPSRIAAPHMRMASDLISPSEVRFMTSKILRIEARTSSNTTRFAKLSLGSSAHTSSRV